ncbi:DUF4436 domain-containing protein [Mycobacterium montefiorense]|uniref:DUF4436 domain-containing protein n=1 Tax=Mycobacterium montefiorense TaxID=154654 RepID=UPI0021DEC548|nr:DUF4436 domain-containing protein [Mycobacterium montefiorense]GLE52128.1 DUF4436 domain-containing protein [Mycobacterium montefiorense]
MNSRRSRLGIAGVVLLVAAYVVSIALYIGSGMGHRNVAVRGFTAPDVPKVTIDVQEVQTNNSLLIADVSVAPGPSMLDPQTHSLKEDLTIAVTSAVTASKRTWPKGTLPDVFRVSLAVAGEVAEWPFDEYHSGPIVAELLSGSSNLRLAATVTLVDRILGWDIEVNRLDEADLVSPYQVDVMRAPSTVAFGVVILAVLIALAAFGAFVAVQTVRDRRQFQPPMTTWYAAMLFAVVPLRNALPDAPPFGSWIDITIVLWVIVVLVISMGLYISCWWRHLRPEPEQPAALE